jgi:phosphoglucomutase
MIQTLPTTPIAGMKPGTSGLRKRVSEFAAGSYLPNFVQSVFEAVRPEAGFAGLTLVVAWLRPMVSRACWSARAASCQRLPPAA